MVQRQCMSDEIRDALANRIYDGTLAPGDRLVELAIAQEFGTSQTPVREALRELEAQRLVLSEPYKGTRVREITPREMAESYRVRAVLEQAAAESAASFLKDNPEPLRTIVTQICAAAEAGHIDLYAQLNLEFHRMIVAESRNLILLQCWDDLRFESRIRVNLHRQSNQIVARAEEHYPIIEALECGDGVLAGQLLREHSESFAAVWAKEISAEQLEDSPTQPPAS